MFESIDYENRQDEQSKNISLRLFLLITFRI
jgi:hypothetical protein